MHYKLDYYFALYFINLDCNFMARYDYWIKSQTNHLDWRDDWIIIYFSHYKTYQEVNRNNEPWNFITIILCHNAALFYILHYNYFMTLIWLLMEVPKYNLETYNTTDITDFNECNRNRKGQTCSTWANGDLGDSFNSKCQYNGSKLYI